MTTQVCPCSEGTVEIGERVWRPERPHSARGWGRGPGVLLLLSAAFGGPRVYQGLIRVKSRFIFAYVSYSSRSTAGDKGSALQWSPKNKP